LRILTLANTPLDDASGSGYVVLSYAEGLRARGHAVELLGPRDFEPFHGAARGIRYRQALGMATSALARATAHAYDVVELYGGEGWLASLLLTRLPRRRFIVVAHSNGLEPHCTEVLARARRAGALSDRRSWFQADLSAAEALGFRAVDGLVTVSAFDAEYASRRAFAHGRVLAIENPLPAEYLAGSFKAEREPLIGFVGAWLPLKGIELIVREIPGVLREFPGWRFVLVGVGERFRAEQHFPSDILPRIEVVPRADRNPQLKALYSRFTIVVLPSLYESFGLVAAEAMACGAALVASAVGFARSLRDGEQALLLPEPGISGLGEALRRLIADDALRSSIARAGFERVQRLRWPQAVETLERAYLGWLDAHRGPPTAREAT
jgi:D-inositol-3-phosphate glycosyltransferase